MLNKMGKTIALFRLYRNTKRRRMEDTGGGNAG